MVASALQVAKQALLVTMRAVVVGFGMTLTCNRDSADTVGVTSFRKLALRCRIVFWVLNSESVFWGFSSFPLKVLFLLHFWTPGPI